MKYEMWFALTKKKKKKMKQKAIPEGLLLAGFLVSFSLFMSAANLRHWAGFVVVSMAHWTLWFMK